MGILKFKSQLTITFFAAVSHLNGSCRKQNFTLMGSKEHGLWYVIGGFRSVLCVSLFQGSLLVIVIMIDGSEKRNCEGGFWTLEFACLWKAQLFCYGTVSSKWWECYFRSCTVESKFIYLLHSVLRTFIYDPLVEWQKTRGRELLAEASKNKETGEVTNEEVSIDPGAHRSNNYYFRL